MGEAFEMAQLNLTTLNLDTESHKKCMETDIAKKKYKKCSKLLR